MDNTNAFIRELENKGFKRYILQYDDEVVVNLNTSLGKQLFRHIRSYDVAKSDIATDIFGAISNTDSYKIYFFYQQMYNFIIKHNPNNADKDLENDTKWVLSDLSSLNMQGTTLPIIFTQADFNTKNEIISLSLSPLSVMIFGTPSFRASNRKRE